MIMPRTSSIPSGRVFIVHHGPAFEMVRGSVISLPMPGVRKLAPLCWTALTHNINMSIHADNRWPIQMLFIQPEDETSPSERGLLIESRMLWTTGPVITRVFNLLSTYVSIPKGESISRLVCL